METPDAQIRFLQQVKAQLLPHQSLVEEIADVLGLSTDSAYRRIRGEKPLDLPEVQKIGARFRVSIDQYLFPQTEGILFTGRQPLQQDHALERWLQDVENQLTLVNRFLDSHIYFIIKDIPLFYHFQIPELAEFKFFFWMKSILHDDQLRGVKFRLGDARYSHLHVACQRIIKLYTQVATTEIWNVESLNSALRQIQFYHESGNFASDDDVRLLYAKVSELLDYVETQAEHGVKCILSQVPASTAPPYRLFVNELILGDNTFAAELGNTRITFLNHSVLYFVGTRDEGFNDFMFAHLSNLMKKSTLISGTGEKERTQFFNSLRRNLHTHALALR
ncbi:helix-turn-helix domain-containing protein [Hymenobacter rubidus]|uniref:helix-turn-helix domain-containing protein n=1 Tax=Hymenobacter rubidus TaxID=1441626 RepID=UPI00191FD7AC|nr:helix-turn-helix domain-containing protein [Hymenobacter rubidus]